MTINSPDDISAAINPPADVDPLTDTTDIDWLRSETEKRTSRTPASTAPEVHVKHSAYFGVNPGSVRDVLAEYSKTVAFEPRFLSAEWSDGALSRVSLSGPQRLKAGGTSDKQTRRREWRNWGASRSNAVDKGDLPGVVAEALTAYETAVSTERNGARR